MGLCWGWFRRVRVGRRRQASELGQWSLLVGCTGRALLVVGKRSPGKDTRVLYYALVCLFTSSRMVTELAARGGLIEYETLLDS
jgi:hypothetical protein